MKKIVLVAVCASALSANAEFYTANKMLSMFQSSDSFEQAIAYGYTAGVFDQTFGILHCAPGEVSIKQVGDMVIQKLLKFPGERHRSADTFVRVTLTEAFPCNAPAAPSGTQKPQAQQSGKSV